MEGSPWYSSLETIASSEGRSFFFRIPLDEMRLRISEISLQNVPFFTFYVNPKILEPDDKKWSVSQQISMGKGVNDFLGVFLGHLDYKSCYLLSHKSIYILEEFPIYVLTMRP